MRNIGERHVLPHTLRLQHQFHQYLEMARLSQSWWQGRRRSSWLASFCLFWGGEITRFGLIIYSKFVVKNEKWSTAFAKAWTAFLEDQKAIYTYLLRPTFIDYMLPICGLKEYLPNNGDSRNVEFFREIFQVRSRDGLKLLCAYMLRSFKDFSRDITGIWIGDDFQFVSWSAYVVFQGGPMRSQWCETL